MKSVIAKFIKYIEENQETNGKANGQTKDIYNGKSFLSDQVSEGGEYIVSDHDLICPISNYASGDKLQGFRILKFY